jgi:hypothetical protein
MLSDMATALVPITATAWQAAQRLIMGRRLRRPSERSERLKFIVSFNLKGF